MRRSVAGQDVGPVHVQHRPAQLAVANLEIECSAVDKRCLCGYLIKYSVN